MDKTPSTTYTNCNGLLDKQMLQPADHSPGSPYRTNDLKPDSQAKEKIQPQLKSVDDTIHSAELDLQAPKMRIWDPLELTGLKETALTDSRRSLLQPLDLLNCRWEYIDSVNSGKDGTMITELPITGSIENQSWGDDENEEELPERLI